MIQKISKLGERFEVDIPPYASAVFAELSEKIYGGLPFGEVGEQAQLRARTEPPTLTLPKQDRAGQGDGLQLVRYRPLFSGPAVERIPELQFQRPEPEIELSRRDAEARGIAPGDTVRVSHNGTSLELRARISRDVRQGVARIAAEHAGDLGGAIEVTK